MWPLHTYSVGLPDNVSSRSQGALLPNRVDEDSSPPRFRDRQGNSWSTECDLGGTAKQECNRREGTAWPCFMLALRRPRPSGSLQAFKGLLGRATRFSTPSGPGYSLVIP